MPILSDPTSEDSDGDKFLDCIDFYSSDEALNASVYFNVDDPNPLKKEIVWEWLAYYSNGITIDRLQSSFREKKTDEQGNITYYSGIDISPKSGRQPPKTSLKNHKNMA